MGWDRPPSDVFAEIYDQDFSAAFRDLSLQALSSVVLKTPVDTGRLRGGWLVNKSTASGQITVTTDKAGQGTISKGNRKIANAKFGDVLVIENNVEYGIFLEEGTDKIAPRRMIGRTITELVGFFG